MPSVTLFKYPKFVSILEAERRINGKFGTHRAAHIVDVVDHGYSLTECFVQIGIVNKIFDNPEAVIKNLFICGKIVFQ